VNLRIVCRGRVGGHHLQPSGVKSTKGRSQPDAGNEASVARQPKKNVNAQPAMIVKSISSGERRPEAAARRENGHDGVAAVAGHQHAGD
jgi:hypothetical protein